MDELTIAFKIESPPSWLPIGRTAENNWRTVEIDCSYWFNMSANGEVVLMYKPSCGMSPYPLQTERDGDNIIWRPKSGELVDGVGRLQAFFEVGTDVIGSSDMISCEVDSSLLGVDPGTDPGQTDLPWALDIIAQIAELSGHYPKIENGVLYVWDSEQEDWVQFQGGGGSANAVLYTAQSLTESQKAQARTNVGAGTYSKPASGIPKSDLASAVQTSLGKADTALQTAPVTSVNNKTGAVTVKTPYYLTVTTENDTVYVDKTPAEIDALSAAGYDVHIRYPYEGEVLDARFNTLIETEALFGVAAGVAILSVFVLADRTVSSYVLDIQNELSQKADKSDIPAMATAPNMSDWTSGKTVDAAALRTTVAAAALQVSDLEDEVDALESAGYQTAQDVQTAINGVRQLPAVSTTDNGKFLRVVSGAWAAETVSTWQGGSY